MVDDRTSERIEAVNDRIDRAADRLHPRGEGIDPVPDRDIRITRLFPYFVVLCLLVWVVSLIYINNFSLSKLIEILCLSFVACFAALGVPCVLFMDRGAFSNWVTFAMALLLTGLLWVSAMFTGHVYYADAITQILAALGLDLSDNMQIILGFCGTLALIFFTSIGVLTVISAYMRRYMGRVFRSIEYHAAKGDRGRAEWFFMVPDIIDVKGVVLEKKRSYHTYDFRTALSVSTYLFILGLLVSSYVFVNPLLITLMDWSTMLAITLMLSMFTPALVLPWQIVRGVGARVTSDAPRDYYLWTGARKRLFSTFATLGVFMMMFVLSVYLGNSVRDIFETYLAFLVPLFVTSVIYGAIYVNNFDRSVCDTICDDFENGGSREDP